MRKMLCVVVTSMGILFANCNSPVPNGYGFSDSNPCSI